MTGSFFVHWALWEEMTFVLACAIVVVFIIGIIKLVLTNRRLRRLEKIDVEKQARVTEMRKAGVNQRRKGNDIPFGVRAIQSGIEVDGIWISRPTTPRSVSSNTKLLASTSNSDNGKQPESRPYTGSTMNGVGATRAPTGLSAPMGADHLVAGHAPAGSDASEAPSNLSTPLPQISEDGTFPTTEYHDTLNEEALRRLEGNYSPPQNVLREQQMPTYVPTRGTANGTTQHSRQYYNPTTGYRGSNGSGDSMSSSGRSDRSASSGSRQGRRSHDKASPPHSPLALSAFPSVNGGQSSTSVPPTTYANTSSRKINPGFEVLPAGTFNGGMSMSRNPSNHSSADDEAEPEVAVRESLLSGRNKLRKQTPQ